MNRKTDVDETIFMMEENKRLWGGKNSEKMATETCKSLLAH